MMRRLLALVLALLMALAMTGCGGGEEQPEATEAPEEEEQAEREPAWQPKDTVNIIVPAKAGSLNDITARVLAQYLESVIGQTVNVENIPGAYEEKNEAGEVTLKTSNGALGWMELAERKADGLTLGYVELPTYTNALQAWSDLISDDDYTPICTHTTQTAIIIARSGDERFTTLEKMIRYGKKAETPLVAATNGEHGLLHTWTQLFCKDADLPYEPNHKDSVNAALQSVRDSSSDFAIVRADDILERDEGLRVLAVFGDEQLPLYPDAPTVSEQGYYPYWLGYAYCVMAPAGVDPDVVAFYEKAFREAMSDERYQQASSGVTNDYMDADETAALLSQQKRISLRKYNSLWW